MSVVSFYFEATNSKIDHQIKIKNPPGPRLGAVTKGIPYYTKGFLYSIKEFLTTQRNVVANAWGGVGGAENVVLEPARAMLDSLCKSFENRSFFNPAKGRALQRPRSK